MTKTTDFLVLGGGVGASKISAAKAKGCKCITEADFMQLVSGADTARRSPRRTPRRKAADKALWQAVVRTGTFDAVRVTVGDTQYPLRDDQCDALRCWLSGDPDKEWLVCAGGAPAHFIGNDGSESALSLDHDQAMACLGQEEKEEDAANAGAEGGNQPPLHMKFRSPEEVSKGCLLATKMCKVENQFATGELRYDQYAATEKHDGHRGIWHKGQMFTRRGNKKEPCCRFFAKFLPNNLTLDGEIRSRSTKDNRGLVPGLIGRLDKDGEDSDIGYFVFDAPFLSGGYLQRLAEAKKLIGNCKFVEVVEARVCKTREALRDFRTEVVKAGGEGLVLHRLDAPYRFQTNSVRSSDAIKYKERYDQEVKVTSYSSGYAICLWPAGGKKFKVQLAGQKTKPKIGSLITIEYIGLTKSGLPESPVFKDLSPDRQDWAWVVAQFPSDATHKGALRRVITLECPSK